MYILDALYGKIEFNPLIYKCMLTPEVQRLREVRLCNINSLCITGSANTNRFEHSIGTAFLASININSTAQEHLALSKTEKDLFVLSALLHDVANAPFGHSCEYIMEKQGLVPEKGLTDVFASILSTGDGIYSNSTPFETNFFNMPKMLSAVLKDKDLNVIAELVSGEHMLSRLISDDIDLDNIDNVFRMAYHMGLVFTKNAPVVLAKSMYLDNGKIYFKKEAEPYLNEWYKIRKDVYNLLLLNPQEFSGKCMLTEAMDILFESIRESSKSYEKIKWHYIDYELLTVLNSTKEVWLPSKILLCTDLKVESISSILSETDEDKIKSMMKDYIESITLQRKIKARGKSGNSEKIILDDNYTLEVSKDREIKFTTRNMTFEIVGNKLYKLVYGRYNPSQIVSRLVTGDLYDCLMIIETSDINKYEQFLDYSKRMYIEKDIEYLIQNFNKRYNLSVALHPILDKNKTERSLLINFEGDISTKNIGAISSNKLLIGVFIKNEPYGLKSAKKSKYSQDKELLNGIIDYFSNFFDEPVKSISLYKEGEKYEH